MPPERSRERKTKVTGAGAAGAGGGTLVAVLGNSLSDKNSLKPWLVLIAPSVSILFGAIWLWVQLRFLNYLREREIKSLIRNAKQALTEASKNPKISKTRLLTMQKQLEELESITVVRALERIKTLAVLTKSDLDGD